ncbi:mandelate racemase/muconate lactonizing enzyme family protein [Salibacterium aidingense]|uniref:mandelate racemase/muconate lactonizing enzyme family protein n=1 Tax=Salibacterium aidingense TaxID=384933 RepID=UPI003BDF3453
MKITEVNAYPLNATFEKYFGGIDEVPEHFLVPSANFKVSPRKGQCTTVVEIKCDNGSVGYGEAFGLPDASYSAAFVNNTFAPVLTGRNPLEIFKLWETMMSIASGLGNTAGPMFEAISGIDIALWDLKGKVMNVPAYELLGGKVKEEIYCYASPIMLFKTTEETKNRAQELIDAGFTAMKLKIGRDVQTDMLHIKAVREQVGFDIKLMLDMNCGYEGRVHEAIRLAHEAEPYDIYWLEEPVPLENLDAYKTIKRNINIQMAAGENSFTFMEFKRVIQSGVLDVIMPNLSRAGGITGAYHINMFATANNVKLSPHGVGSGINILAASHLMTPFTNSLLFEYNQFLNPLRHTILNNQIEYNNSYITLSEEAPGLGIDINWDTIRTYMAEGWEGKVFK